MATELPFSRAIEGFFQFKTAAGLSPNTLADYRNCLSKLTGYLDGDPPIANLTHEQLVAFFGWLTEDYQTRPDGIAPRGKQKLSAKTISNIHIALSSLWTWAVERGYVDEHVVRSIPRPRTPEPAITAFTREEVGDLLRACKYTRRWSNQTTRSRRRTADRDRAIILVLLDTGIRASELCNANLSDLDLNKRKLVVRGKSQGRDPKVRSVRLDPRTTDALWQYLRDRMEDSFQDDPLFVVGQHPNTRRMKRAVLWKLISRLGKKAGVEEAHPHRFRHTFAIEFLRNGGDILTLKELLGHASLEMVENYARVAEVDLENTHRRASPVRNWEL